MRYEYVKEIKEDVIDFIRNEIEAETLENTTRYDVFEELYDKMWSSDEVTGNGSKSGYVEGDNYLAEEYVSHNLDILIEALDYWGCENPNGIDVGIYCDTTIRCHLLGEILDDVMDEFWTDENGFNLEVA